MPVVPSRSSNQVPFFNRLTFELSGYPTLVDYQAAFAQPDKFGKLRGVEQDAATLASEVLNGEIQSLFGTYIDATSWIEE
ncbi:hypothetical protein D3C86_1975320 [compost metagenome]